MKKYVITGGILLGGLFLMNGGGTVIGMAFAHGVAFLIKAILLIVFGLIGIGVLWRLIGQPLIGCAGVLTVLGVILWLSSLF